MVLANKIQGHFQVFKCVLGIFQGYFSIFQGYFPNKKNIQRCKTELNCVYLAKITKYYHFITLRYDDYSVFIDVTE